MPNSILGQLVKTDDVAQTQEKKKRLERAKEDFAFFCQHYLRDYFFSDFAEYQKVILSAVNEEQLTKEHIKRLKPLMQEKYHKELKTTDMMKAIINVEPRGHGKTTRMCFAYPMWRLLFLRSRFIVMFGASAESAQANVDLIKTELETNERIIEDFGTMRGDIWTAKYATFSNNTAIKAFGAGSSARGSRYKQYRPDLVIIDDLLKDEEANSKAVRSKRYEWFLRSVIPLGKQMQIVMTNTILHDDDVVSRLLKRVEKGELPQWVAFRFSCLIHKSGELQKAKSLWPEYWTRKELLEKKQEVGSRAFSIEYMNEPLSPDEALFSADWIRELPAGLDTKSLAIYMAVDPSAGAHDRTAMVVVGVASDGKRYVLDCWARRSTPNAVVKAIIDMHSKYDCKKIGFEAVSFQTIYKNFILEKAREQGVRLPIVEVSPKGRSKYSRIEKLSPHIENGLYSFNTARCGLLLDELCMYPKHEYDDLCDAFAYVDELADGRSRGVPQVFQGPVRASKRFLNTFRNRRML